MAGSYNPKEIEPEMLDFWEKNRIYEKASGKNRGKHRFYFIDGPPYTSGAIHIGHAWNKALKDVILRYKRMRGFDAWSQPGFDMHGLPIEVAVEKKLGIKNKKEISEMGVQKFIEECEKFSLEQMHPMIKDFSRLGVWMDWDNPYMTIKSEYIEGAWWALSEANKNGYLYEGKKSMTWCPRCATALAKHELTYKDLTDKSVFVRLKVIGEPRTFLIVWTTTPWTLPFNLAVMCHPDFEYVKAEAENGEKWILAKALAKQVISGICGMKFEAGESFRGSDLKGMKYETPFREEIEFHRELKNENAYSVLMSSEFVNLEGGTGLVHMAPGCGPEDFEMGKKNDLPPFNTLDEQGYFRDAGKYTGMRAKENNDQILIDDLDKKKLLAATNDFAHEYPCCWRCETPVIYRATEQWFLATEKLKEKMLSENERVRWVPDWGGTRWFESWLQNIQDWCISRQRFWGIPLPIWRCGNCNDTMVIGSMKELPGKISNLHRPWIDDVTLQCECGSEMKRIPDVLDVWLDSGAASWAPLGYPGEEKLFEELWPADFILEGKDQIRGWFNSMICLSMVSHRKSSYKAVYMHGFVNDAMGRKMSKSLKNTISPYEVIDEYGADTLRYYAIGGAKPGFDLNYNFEDMKLKNKNLTVFWNIQNFLLELAETADIEGEKELSTEERYMLSKLHSSIQKATYMFDNYYLNETPWVVEELLLELSRTYIQLTRDKASGTDEERNTVLHTVFTVYMESLRMLAPIAPFIAEKIHHNLKEKFKLGESIHLDDWPSFDLKMIDEELEKGFATAKSAIQAILSAREKAKLGIRWPLKEAVIVTTELKEEVLESIKKQTNVKEIKVVSKFDVKTSVKADYQKLEPAFGSQKATRIIAALAMTSPETVLRYIEKDGSFNVSIDDEKVSITLEHMTVSKVAPHGFEYVQFEQGEVLVNIMTSPELEAEGYARELMRRIQSMRKKAGLKKPQRIRMSISTDSHTQQMLHGFKEQIMDRTGADGMEFGAKMHGSHSATEKIRDKEIQISFKVVE